MNQSSLLHQLQKIDIEIGQCSARIKEIMDIIKSDRTIQDAEILADEAQRKFDKSRKQLNSAEADVDAAKLKIQINESNLYSGMIKNPKELQDLQSELESLNRRLESLENLQLEKLIIFEEEENNLKIDLENVKKTKDDFFTLNARLLGEKDTLEKKLQRLDHERNVTVSSVIDENLKVYNDLRNKKLGIAVALIEENSCSVCGTTIRPAEYQLARSPQQLAYCSSCGRILFAG